MLSTANNYPTPRMLRIYEVMGGKGLPAPPAEGLAGVWPQPPWYYLFYETEASGAVAAWLAANPGWRLTSQYSIPYEKWQDVPEEDLRVGRFTVIPAGGRNRPRPPDSSVPVLIDPGVVFGSGLHPTTRGCLLAISDLFSRISEGIVAEIDSVLDLGTGTGILAIACALLGAARVRAIDIIPFALAVARRNAAANGVEERISFICADRMEVLNAPSDLLLMNIEWPVLEQALKGDEWRRCGRVVLSGFLEGLLGRVEGITGASHDICGKAVIEGWPTISLVRRC